MRSIQWITAFATVALLGFGNFAVAAETKTTTISIPMMHCEGCAKKVVDQVQKVPGVEKVEVDLKAKTIKITPRANPVPSPKALWEAVEKADKLPTKIEGPSGTFTDKPTK